MENSCVKPFFFENQFMNSMTWVKSLNGWIGNETGFEYFFFSSWISWLLLHLFYRTIFGISRNITPLFNLIKLHYVFLSAYLIETYTEYSNQYSHVILYVYLIAVVLIVFIYYLVIPIMKHPITSIQMPKCIKGSLIALHIGLLLTAGIYIFSYILVQQIGSLLCEGIMFNQVISNQPLLPKLFLNIISMFAWLIILITYGKRLENDAEYKNSTSYNEAINGYDNENFNMDSSGFSVRNFNNPSVLKTGLTPGNSEHGGSDDFGSIIG